MASELQSQSITYGGQQKDWPQQVRRSAGEMGAYILVARSAVPRLSLAHVVPFFPHAWQWLWAHFSRRQLVFAWRVETLRSLTWHRIRALARTLWRMKQIPVVPPPPPGLIGGLPPGMPAVRTMPCSKVGCQRCREGRGGFRFPLRSKLCGGGRRCISGPKHGKTSTRPRPWMFSTCPRVCGRQTSYLTDLPRSGG